MRTGSLGLAGLASRGLVLASGHASSETAAHHAPSYTAFGTEEQQILSTTSEQGGCAFACSVLASQYGEQHVFTPNGTAYTDFQQGYWSQFQSEAEPACIFEAPHGEAVSSLVRLIRESQCPFAVKSGGHGAFTGASSSHGGITLSLRNLNGIELSTDKQIASIGPGNVWRQVYSALGKEEVTVIGGRVEQVGVGGFTLGGGLSFFSGFHGWACDNVEAYDLVTATGAMITASPTEHPDLYWALRGGGNNFGIVTTFHLRTIPMPHNVVWGGARLYLESDFSELTKAFTHLGLNAAQDPGAGQWTAFVTYNSTKMASTTLWYDAPANLTHTKIFDDFDKLSPISDDAKTRDLVDFVETVTRDNPYGKREIFYTMTTQASAELADFAVETFYSVFDRAGLDSSVFPAIVFQSLTAPQIANMAQNGGNSLGLDAHEGPLFIISVPTMWDDASDDDQIYSLVSEILYKISDKAKEMGLSNEYIYMNYASKFQDVIRGYGAANKARLIEIANKYDPEGIFQTLQPGYFKLNGPPVESDYFSGSWS